jgi:hypothetical protein
MDVCSEKNRGIFGEIIQVRKGKDVTFIKELDMA